jgi:glycosyltransferase 2 family protein
VTRFRWWRALQWVLGLVVVGLAVRALLDNWDQLVAQQVNWQFRPAWIAAALGVMLLSYVLQIEAWRQVVKSIGYPLRWTQAARVCTVSNLGKYIPGKVWAIAGAAMLAQREGVAAGAAVAAAILLQGLALASGVAVSAFLAPELLTGLGVATRIGVVVVGVLAVLGSFGLGVPAVRGMLQRFLPASAPALPAIDVRVLGAALLVNAAVWGMTGLSFIWLAKGLVPAPGLSWALATAVFTLAYVAGLVALFAPGGVGVRESLLVLLLQAAIGYKLALALALASRVLLTCTELGAALPFLAGSGRAPLTSNDPGTR